MSKKQKRLDRLRSNTNNVSLDDLKQVLEDFGFSLERSSGSHHIFKVFIKSEYKTLIVPFARPIQPVYVKNALELIDLIIANEEKDDTDTD